MILQQDVFVHTHGKCKLSTFTMQLVGKQTFASLWHSCTEKWGREEGGLSANRYLNTGQVKLETVQVHDLPTFST